MYLHDRPGPFAIYYIFIIEKVEEQKEFLGAIYSIEIVVYW